MAAKKAKKKKAIRRRPGGAIRTPKKKKPGPRRPAKNKKESPRATVKKKPSPPSPPLDSRGAGGGPRPDQELTRGDLALAERAIRSQWEIRKETYQVLPNQALGIAIDTTRDARDRLGAMRILALMHQQNQADDPATRASTVHVQHEHRITDEQRRDRILRALGRIKAAGGFVEAGEVIESEWTAAEPETAAAK